MLRNTTKIHRLISNQAIFRICNHSKNFVTLAFNIHCWERKLYLTIHARQFLLLIQNFTLCQISVFGAFLAVTNRIGNITNLSSFYVGLVLFAICSLIYGFPFRLLNLCATAFLNSFVTSQPMANSITPNRPFSPVAQYFNKLCVCVTRNPNRID